MKKGFTLIELLGVIAILGVLAVIAVPAISNTLNGGKEKLSVVQKQQIIKAAKEYYSDHPHNLKLPDDVCNDSNSVSLYYLKPYLSDELNSFDSEVSVKVKVSKSNNDDNTSLSIDNEDDSSYSYTYCYCEGDNCYIPGETDSDCSC